MSLKNNADFALTSNKEKKEKEPPSAEGGSLAEFSDLWRLIHYRPGDAQEEVRRAFARALANGAKLEAMLRGGANYNRFMEQHPEERQFSVSAARWIREKRWEDWQEPPAEPKRRLPGLF
jgi:hypothetical protein